MLKPGDRVGYTASFVRLAGGGGYDTACRRGTVLKVVDDFALVRWDDFDPSDYDDDPEYRDHVTLSGQRVALRNLAKPGSLAFCDPHAESPRRYRGRK